MSATVACMYLGDFFFCKFLDLRKNRDKISKGLCRNKCHFYCHNNIEHKHFVSCLYSVAIMILGMILKIHHCSGIFFKPALVQNASYHLPRCLLLLTQYYIFHCVGFFVDVRYFYQPTAKMNRQYNPNTK